MAGFEPPQSSVVASEARLQMCVRCVLGFGVPIASALKVAQQASSAAKLLVVLGLGACDRSAMSRSPAWTEGEPL